MAIAQVCVQVLPGFVPSLHLLALMSAAEQSGRGNTEGPGRMLKSTCTHNGLTIVKTTVLPQTSLNDQLCARTKNGYLSRIALWVDCLNQPPRWNLGSKDYLPHISDSAFKWMHFCLIDRVSLTLSYCHIVILSIGGLSASHRQSQASGRRVDQHESQLRFLHARGLQRCLVARQS